jgi:hypothetical protein
MQYDASPGVGWRPPFALHVGKFVSGGKTVIFLFPESSRKYRATDMSRGSEILLCGLCDGERGNIVPLFCSFVKEG